MKNSDLTTIVDEYRSLSKEARALREQAKAVKARSGRGKQLVRMFEAKEAEIEAKQAEFADVATRNYEGYVGRCYAYRDKYIQVSRVAVRGDNTLLVTGLVFKHTGHNLNMSRFSCDFSETLVVENPADLVHIAEATFMRCFDDTLGAIKSSFSNRVGEVRDAAIKKFKEGGIKP